MTYEEAYIKKLNKLLDEVNLEPLCLLILTDPPTNLQTEE